MSTFDQLDTLCATSVVQLPNVAALPIQMSAGPLLVAPKWLPEQLNDPPLEGM
jgi:hypothetical protein